MGLSMMRNCRKIGVDCKMRSLELSVMWDWNLKHTFDASTAGWAFGTDYIPYNIFHSSQAKDGWNYGVYSNPEMDRLIETGRAELDRDKREQIKRNIHHLEWEEQPYTFLFGQEWLWVLNKRVKNIKTYDGGFQFLEWEIEGHEDGN
jgi:peptide/nickel transport system substrate-binding protein